MESILPQLTVSLTIVTLYNSSKAIRYYLNRYKKREGGVCEGVYINQLKALESRVAFLELKEYEIKDFVHYDDDNDFGWLTLAKSERDYGDKIRVGKNVLIRKPITQTNQKYYEYVYQADNKFRVRGECIGRAH